MPIATSYTVNHGVFEVPSTWNMSIGMSGQIRKLYERFPPLTPFQLKINDAVLHSGELETHELAGEGGTLVKLDGRDYLRRLQITKLNDDRTFSEKTFLDLTKTALGEVGLGDRTVASDNIANRKAITGKSVKTETKQVEEETAIGTDGGVQTVYNTIKGEVGETWFDFLTKQNRRAGLFLWSAADGNFVLSRPDGAQAPLYAISRRRGAKPGDVTVLGHPTFKRSVRTRPSEVRVLGRGGGGKDGRGRIIGRAFDDEIIALLNPNEADRADGGKRQQVEVVVDKKVKTKAQAEFLARRKLAEFRRQNFSLEIKVLGHTTVGLGGGDRIPWLPDTTVYYMDDEFGFDGPMYIANCKYVKSPQTYTVLTLMPPHYLVFAEEDFDTIPQPKAAKTAGKGGFPWIQREDWRDEYEPDWDSRFEKPTPKPTTQQRLKEEQLNKDYTQYFQPQPSTGFTIP